MKIIEELEHELEVLKYALSIDIHDFLAFYNVSNIMIMFHGLMAPFA